MGPGGRGSWVRPTARPARLVPSAKDPIPPCRCQAKRSRAARLRDWAVYALIVFFSMVQEVGRTTLDTRVELSERPRRSSRAASASGTRAPTSASSSTRPTATSSRRAPFFALVELVGMPAWVGQRLWSALVLLVAFEGARRCARVLGFDASAASLAGLVFAFSPRLLGTVGVISAESLPGAVLPWVVLPVLLRCAGRLRAGTRRCAQRGGGGLHGRGQRRRGHRVAADAR